MHYMVKLQRSGDWKNYFAKTLAEANFVAKIQIAKGMYSHAKIYSMNGSEFILLESI